MSDDTLALYSQLRPEIDSQEFYIESQQVCARAREGRAGCGVRGKGKTLNPSFETLNPNP